MQVPIFIWPRDCGQVISFPGSLVSSSVQGEGQIIFFLDDSAGPETV